jgi:hypothetical protein
MPCTGHCFSYQDTALQVAWPPASDQPILIPSLQCLH